jgi:hypothetical protein
MRKRPTEPTQRLNSTLDAELYRRLKVMAAEKCIRTDKEAIEWLVREEWERRHRDSLPPPAKARPAPRSSAGARRAK